MSDHASVASAWANFYVIVGSSGGALIGLQFVVITLIAERRPASTGASVSAFGTPTVVHLAGALVVSAMMSAPWRSVAALTLAIEACAAFGVAYGAVVFRRARRQTEYQPVWQDWVWYAALPWCAYAALAAAAGWLSTRPDVALFGIAGAALALLLIGIHNAWDTVTHIVISGISS